MATFDVLVTGSAGHLGTALMLTLPSMGYRPIGIDILASETTTHVGSVSNRDFVRSIFDRYPGVRYILHTATLHKPHIGSHTYQDFLDTNITGTLVLLEAAASLREADDSKDKSSLQIQAFVYISTTSAFGSALQSKPGSPAVWIDESVTPVPKNIYGVTKVAAENLCHLISRQSGMPTVVLRTSRFFPEADDDPKRRAAFAVDANGNDTNLKVLELAYRRCDIADIVEAAVAAMARAPQLGWGKYIVSAPTPFSKQDRQALDAHPSEVFSKAVPASTAVFAQLGWAFPLRIDRVYDSSKAMEDLGWEPRYTFERALHEVKEGREWRSNLAVRVGKKGYHAVSTGVYTRRE